MQKDYNINQNNTKKTIVWLLNEKNQIFLKRNNSLELNIESYTVAGDSILEAILKAENFWGIACCQDNLKKIESFMDDNGVENEVYVLNLVINKELENFIIDQTLGAFVDLDEIKSFIENHKNLSISTYLESIISDLKRVYAHD